MKNKLKVNAAVFISRLEERRDDINITRAEERVLLKDMTVILDKAVTPDSKDIFFHRRFNMLRVETETYRRVYNEGVLLAEVWLLKKQCHREDDNPAYIDYYESGAVKTEEWYFENIKEREGGKPVHIDYHENGEIKNAYDRSGLPVQLSELIPASLYDKKVLAEPSGTGI